MTSIDLNYFQKQMQVYFDDYNKNNYNSSFNFVAYTQSRANGMNLTDLFQNMENFLEGSYFGDSNKDTLDATRYYSDDNKIFLECNDGTLVYFNPETGEVCAGNEATELLLGLKNVPKGSYDNMNFDLDQVTFTDYTFAGLKDGVNKTTNGNVVKQELDLRDGKQSAIQKSWSDYTKDHKDAATLKDLFGEENYKNDGSFSGSKVQYLDDNTAIIYQEYGSSNDEYSAFRPVNNGVYKVTNENGNLVIKPLDDDTITSLIGKENGLSAPQGVTACPPGAMRVWSVDEAGKIHFDFHAQMNDTGDTVKDTDYEVFSLSQINALSDTEKAAATHYLTADTLTNGMGQVYQSAYVLNERGDKTNKPVFIIAKSKDGEFRLFGYNEDDNTYESVVDRDKKASEIETLYVLANNYKSTGANVAEYKYEYSSYVKNEKWDDYTEQYALENGTYANLGTSPRTDQRNKQIKDGLVTDDLSLMLTHDKYMLKTETKKENESLTSKQFISSNEFNALSDKEKAYIKANFQESKDLDGTLAGYTTSWLDANKNPRVLMINGLLFARLSDGRYSSVGGTVLTTYVLNSAGSSVNYTDEQKDVFDETLTKKYYESTTGNIIDTKTEVNYTEDKTLINRQAKTLGVSVYVPPPPPPPPKRDPLIIDSNKDGKVSAKNDMGVDLNEDGIADGAAVDGDGMLSMGDIDGDGVITGKEVFGDNTINPYTGEKLNAANGFEALRMIALEAEVRSGLKILVNGEVDLQLLKRALELTTKASLGLISGDNNTFLEALGDIQSINVQDYENVESTGGMIEHLQQGSYKDNKGNVHKVDDVWFANDPEYLKRLYEYA